MLLQLDIRNLALIREMELEFHPGLNVLTGETGAGKSIIVDAVNLVLGERADREMIAAGQEKARVEAVFDVRGNEAVLALLDEAGVGDEDGALLVSRELTESGRNVCRLNGCMVPLQQLRTITSQLLDLHGQHAHQLLLDSRNHIAYLDGCAAEETAPLREAVRAAYADWHGVRAKLSRLRRDVAEREQRMDLLRFQVNELEGAALQPGEEEELEGRRVFFRNADRIAQAFAEGCAVLLEGTEENASACDLLRRGADALEPVAELSEAFRAPVERLVGLCYEAEDAARELAALRDGLEFDREEAEQVEQRLDLLRRLGRKYGGDSAAMLRHLEAARAELASLEGAEEEGGRLEAEEAGLRERLTRASAALSEKRREIAARFEREMQEQLRDLGMKNGRIEAAFAPPEAGDARFGENGWDRVELLFSANLGQEPRPLAKIASGGELSRIMLALKNLSARKPGVPRSMVFDEIDTGISGRMAQVVAEKMTEIGDQHQVLCVTHLPQIAAMADWQYLVTKTEQDGQTHTEARCLTRAERARALSGMVGGAAGSGLEHAEKMLEEAEARKRELRGRLE